jgi:hypothetical protein
VDGPGPGVYHFEEYGDNFNKSDKNIRNSGFGKVRLEISYKSIIG